MRSVVNNVYAGLSDCERDIICLSETWLDSSISNSELIPKEFHVFRADRDFIATRRKRGGGVLLAVHNKFKVVRIELSKPKFPSLVDVVGCKINCHSQSICILTMYVPPDIPVTDFEYFVECLENYALQYPNLLLIGDFNVPNFFTNANDAKTLSIKNMMSLLNLTQVNTVPNSDGRFLDLVFCSLNSCIVTHDSCPIVIEDKYHPALHINLGVKNTSYVNFPICTTTKIYNFRKANFIMLYEDILNSDWRFLYQITDVDEACEFFYRTLYTILDKHVPIFKCKKYSYGVLHRA